MLDLYRGKLVRLTSESPEAAAVLEMTGQRDTEFHRLADDSPVLLLSSRQQNEKLQKRIELEPDDGYYFFSIRTLETNRLIGVTMLRVDWMHADAILGIAIAERDYWSKGFGADALQLMLQYAFFELNLRRVTLGVSDYNPRARTSYQKAGFKDEGVFRGDGLREGQRSDSYIMSILREEWRANQGVPQ